MGQEEKPSLLENIVFYAGSLILAGLLGYLVFQIIKDSGSPADIQVNVHKSQDKNCVFEVYLKNSGETTAENVNIVLDLYSDGVKVDQGSINVDYLPIRSEQKLRTEFRTASGCDSLVVASILFLEP